MKRISVPGAARTPMGWRRPSPELSVDGLAARYTNKSKGQWTLQTYTARTHARTHVIPPRIHVRPLSVFVLGALPIFLYPYRKMRYGWYRGRNFDVGKPEKDLFESVKIGVKLNKQESSIMRDRWNYDLASYDIVCRIFMSWNDIFHANHDENSELSHCEKRTKLYRNDMQSNIFSTQCKKNKFANMWHTVIFL